MNRKIYKIHVFITMMHIRGCIEKFLAYYRTKQNFNVKIFYYSTYSPLNWIHLLQRTCNVSRPFKKMFLLALQTRPPQLLLPPRWKKIYDLLNFFSVEERDDSRTEPNLVNKGGVLVIQTLNHEFFAWQHEICVQGRCPAKTKHLWIAFRVFSL